MGNMDYKISYRQLLKTIIFGVVTLFIMFSISISAKAQPIQMQLMNANVDEEQIKSLIANDQRVIMKWAQLANLFGFSWCNGTRSQTVGEDFSVTRASNGDYIIQANYNPNDPYSYGERSNERLRITLTDFRIELNPNDFRWQSPTINRSTPIVQNSFVLDNPNTQYSVVNRQYQYSTAGNIIHTSNIKFGDKIRLANPLKTNCRFFDRENPISIEVAEQDGWRDFNKIYNGAVITNNYSTNMPPHTTRTAEQISQSVQSEVKYTATARITYSVILHGFLKNGANARVDHPTDGPVVDLMLGNSGKNAADYLWDLYTHSGTSGYNSWIDWNWVKSNNSSYNDIIENKVYRSPEIIVTSGKFNYTGARASIRDGATASLYPLSTVNVSGTIPNMLIGNSFDLRKLVLSGKDSMNFPYYNFKNLPVTWTITSGNNFAYISGNNLIASGEGTGTLTATVQGIVSNQVNFTISNTPSLKNITISGNVPDLYVGNSYNLSQLVITGTDQYGKPYNLYGLPVSYRISTGSNFASINGSILSANASNYGSPGYGTLTATVAGVTSQPINFTVRDIPTLRTLTITGSLPALYVGGNYDLSRLTLSAADQYGNPYNLTGQSVTWNVVSGGNYIGVSNNILFANNAGTGVITATVKGITSNQVNVTVINYQDNQRILSRISLSGTIPSLYVGDNYALSGLSMTGYDQYGNVMNLSGLQTYWNIASGTNIASITSNVLWANNLGSGAVNVIINGVTSNSINFNIINYPTSQRVLRRLDINSSIPTLYVGGQFDLSRLSMTGYDQYGDVFNIAGLPITWSVISGSNYANTNGNYLSANNPGSGLITATISGVTSDSIGFNILYNSNNQRVLRSLSLSGSIPTLYIGDSYNLSNLSLIGYDQDGYVYNISGQSVTWNVVSGWNNITISSNILRAYGAGISTISATINGITSNPFSIVTQNSPYTVSSLRTLTLSGTIPAIPVGDSYDLSKLSLLGYDQYGNQYNISGQSVTWVVASGTNIANISGNTLRVTGVGNGTIYAYVLGVQSNQINFSTKDASILKTLTLVDTKPTISLGKKYDLSQLTLKGTDQFGNNYNLAGQGITWSVTSTKGSVGVSGNFLISNAEDTGTIIATVQNITSNPIAFRVVKDTQVLTTLTLNGEIPNLYTGMSYDLSKLDLKAVDQYGDSYSLSNQAIAWTVTNGGSSVSISGNNLVANATGAVTIAASVQGVSSNVKTFIILKQAPELKTITISGTLPAMSVGGRYNLSKLTITAKDQYGNPIDIAGKQITWKAQSGTRLAYITGNIIFPVAAGVQNITATIGGVTSNPISVVVKDVSILKTVTTGKTIKELIYGKSYDLSKISLTGKDQYGNSYSIVGKPVTWKIVSGSKYASISGKVLKCKAVGVIKIAAVIGSTTSNSITFIIVRK